MFSLIMNWTVFLAGLYNLAGSALTWSLYAVLAVVLIAGLLLNILGLPGLWLMVLGHVLFGWFTGWNAFVGWPSTLALVGLGLLAEIVEFVAGAAGSAKAGGSRRGMMGAIVGGLVGGIVGSFAIPIPVVGTIIGAVAGSFLGAAVVELLVDPDTGRAMRVGVGAAKGRLAGIIVKSGFGIAMLVVSLATAVPWKPVTPSALQSPPALPPSTQPAQELQPTSQPSTVQPSISQPATNPSATN